MVQWQSILTATLGILRFLIITDLKIPYYHRNFILLLLITYYHFILLSQKLSQNYLNSSTLPTVHECKRDHSLLKQHLEITAADLAIRDQQTYPLTSSSLTLTVSLQ